MDPSATDVTFTDGTRSGDGEVIITVAAPDVAVTKSGPLTILAGNNITYNVGVTNSGTVNAQNVTLADTLPPNTTFVSNTQNTGPTFTCSAPAGSVNCTIATLTAGASATFTLVYNVNANAANGSTVTNTASISTTTSEPVTTNNSQSTSATVINSADLSVTKSGPATSPSNTNVTYIVTAANAGPSAATGVTLTDTLPPGMSFVSANQTSGPLFNCSGAGPVVCTIGSFAAGASASFQFTFNVPGSIAPGTSTTNTATIGSTTSDPNPSNNTAGVTTTIGASIPALSTLALLMLAAVITLLGAMRMRG